MKTELLEIIEDLGISIVDIANYPENDEHLEYAQNRLIELKNLVKNLPVTHSSTQLKEKEETSIEEYTLELIDIIKNPNNSNKDWKEVVIENTLEKINKR